MSHRRWRQSVAPGLSAGIHAAKNNKPSERATEPSAAPAGLWDLYGVASPGLTPGATNMPPANADSSSDVSADPSSFMIFSRFQTTLSIMIADREQTQKLTCESHLK